MDDNFKLALLLSCLRITCKYFKGDEEVCGLSEDYNGPDVEDTPYHITCNCDGDIKKCDLPEKFHICL